MKEYISNKRKRKQIKKSLINKARRKEKRNNSNGDYL